MLPAQRHHQLLIRLLFAVLVQHAHVRLAAVERLGGFAETAGETVVDEGEFEDAFQRFENGHLARWAAARGDFNVLIVGGGDGGGGLFSVRLEFEMLAPVGNQECFGKVFLEKGELLPSLPGA